MLLISVYLWAAYYVERFTISGTTLSIRSMLQNHQFDVSELESLIWRIRPVGGSIVFRVSGTKSRLDLYGYANDDRLRIIKALHDLVPISVQEGWPEFCHKVALPLRDRRSLLERGDLPPKYFKITRKRYDRMAAIAFPLSILVAVVPWIWLNVLEFFALPILVIGMWLLVRFHVPPDGLAETRLTLSSVSRFQRIAWGAILGTPLLMAGLRIWGVEESTAYLIGSIVMGSALLPLLYLQHKADQQQRIADEQAAPSAPGLWLQGRFSEGNVGLDRTV
jgi:hypothetical protein